MIENNILDVPAWPAPAKLNLFLHITGQRPDGYHELQTVFQFLDYGDELRFRLRSDNQVNRINELEGVPAEQDLVVRAARLLQKEAECQQGVDIHVEKNLPMGGGLGGGSSDAATTLVALNQIWQLGFDENRLAKLGLSLGADVPVFVRGRAAWAEGVGEYLQPVDLPEPFFVVLVPKVSVSTSQLFSDLQLTRDARPIKIGDYLSRVKEPTNGQPFSNIEGNVFEPIVRAKYPEIDEAFIWLNQFSPARLTGTGGCVFAAFSNEQEANEVLAKATQQWQSFVAAGCNRSPLKAMVVIEK